jgi:serine/threonine-protein kinase
MAAPLGCPASTSWQLLFADSVPADERERFERHLESCPACQARLDRAAEDEDLLDLAREVGDPTLAQADTTLVQVVDQLLKAKGANSSTAVEAVDLSFLRPGDRPDLLGTLAGYEVRGVIGHGGMGVVLKASDPALDRLVAIKVLAPALAVRATHRQRFTREGQAAAAVRHDHVVTVHGVGQAEGLPYLVMQYVAGESLQHRLDRAGPLPVSEVVRIGQEAASGLAAAHARGLIHRDVKPGNLLLEGDAARVKLTDFGLARTLDEIGLTQSGVVAGTPEYMAPEQARGEVIDHRADLFALGAVLYACCTGAPPFRAATALAVLQQVCEQAPTPLRARYTAVPAWLDVLVARLLAKDPAQRPQSAAEVAELLGDYLAHLRQPGTVPAPELPPPSPLPSSRPWRRHLWPLALLLVAASGLGIALRLAGAGAAPAPGTDGVQEYQLPLRGEPQNRQGLELLGPDAEKCVKFEPAGLRITLPAGYEGGGEKTGLSCALPVRGDFDITVGYEIFQEPQSEVGGKKAAALNLLVVLDRPRWGTTALARRMGGQEQSQFMGWTSLWEDDVRKIVTKACTAPATAKSGRLRVQRTGFTVRFAAAEGAGGDFAPVGELPVTGEDLKEVRLVALTSSTRGPLDVRFSDLHVRVSPRTAAAPPPTARKGWWAGAAVLVVVLASAGWLGLHMRQRRRARPGLGDKVAPGGPAPAVAALSALSFACPECGKTLKVKTELAGKNVKCPGCGKAALVPGGPASASPPAAVADR